MIKMRLTLLFILVVLDIDKGLAQGKLKPGCIPSNPDIRCIWFNDQCKSNDANCPKGEICCGEPCGTSCMKPVCDIPKDTKPCSGSDTTTWWYYNKKNGRCKRFKKGECPNNKNGFSSKKDCNKVKSACVCRLPKEPGKCVAHFTRYYYNTVTNKCEKFIYGGCQGNKNNFKSIAACKRTCGEHPPSSTDQVTCQKGTPLPNKCGFGPGSTPCPKGYYCFHSPSGGSACCQIPCKYGNPHETLSCGMFIGSNKCPTGYHCIGGPADEYFACCPNAKKG